MNFAIWDTQIWDSDFFIFYCGLLSGPQVETLQCARPKTLRCAGPSYNLLYCILIFKETNLFTETHISGICCGVIQMALFLIMSYIYLISIKTLDHICNIFVILVMKFYFKFGSFHFQDNAFESEGHFGLSNKPITTKFCTQQNSYAAILCAKFCNN